MVEKKKTTKAKKAIDPGEKFELTSPPDRNPDSDETIRVNLFVTKNLHKRIRKYAIDFDDKSLVATIQEILDEYLSERGY